MGTTADKLNKLLETKEAIKLAIRDKGVYIGDYDAFDEYPDAIRRIETSSGGSDEFFNLRTQNGTDFSYLFYFYGGSELDLSGLDTSQVIDMNNMFTYSYRLASLNLSNWDTRNVTNMASMFFSCAFYSLDLSSFDTSNVSNMNTMFSNCNNLKELNISSFNTSNVNDMNSMFSYCYGLKSLDLSHFNTSNVINIDSMFSWCNSLEELDIRNFNVNNNIEYVNCMFEGCSMLHTLRLDNCGYDTINKIINSAGFPTGQVNVDGEDINRKMYVQEANATGLTAPDGWEFVSAESDDNEIVPEPEEPEIPEIPEIPLYEVGMFSNAENKAELTEVNVMVNSSHTDLSNMFNGCINLTTINNIEQWDTSNVMYMNHMFYSCSNLDSLDLSNFDTSNVTNMGWIFYSCPDLASLDLSNFDMSNVVVKGRMFYNCVNLHTLRLDNCNNDTINKIITSSYFPTNAIEGVTRKIYVKQENVVNKWNERIEAPENWIFVNLDGEEIVPPKEKPEDPENIPLYERGQFERRSDITEVSTMVTKEYDDLHGMFLECYNLKTINGIDYWDTSHVRDMRQMFAFCISLKTLNLSSFNTSNVNDMDSMFMNCSNLETLDISNFEISNECNVMNMFERCEKLHELRLDNWADDKIERIINDTNLPTGDIDGRLRKMYLPEKYATNPEESGLTAPEGWEFAYELADKKEE